MRSLLTLVALISLSSGIKLKDEKDTYFGAVYPSAGNRDQPPFEDKEWYVYREHGKSTHSYSSYNDENKYLPM